MCIPDAFASLGAQVVNFVALEHAFRRSPDGAAARQAALTTPDRLAACAAALGLKRDVEVSAHVASDPRELRAAAVEAIYALAGAVMYDSNSIEEARRAVRRLLILESDE